MSMRRFLRPTQHAAPPTRQSEQASRDEVIPYHNKHAVVDARGDPLIGLLVKQSNGLEKNRRQDELNLIHRICGIFGLDTY